MAQRWIPDTSRKWLGIEVEGDFFKPAGEWLYAMMSSAVRQYDK